ncbi:MAG TPA: hypothetical protein VD993_11335 [Chitinophagaceae bacterium]|nr:hypothetical protein [Chitinophagaceae bacterium]
MKWVKTLIIADSESIEERLNSIVQYILQTYSPAECVIADIDATGKLGNEITQKINNVEKVMVNKTDVLRLLNEDGQIFEFDLNINSTYNFQIIVGRGQFIDILGDTDLPEDIVGPHTEGDLANYGYL